MRFNPERRVLNEKDEEKKWYDDLPDEIGEDHHTLYDSLPDEIGEDHHTLYDSLPDEIQ